MKGNISIKDFIKQVRDELVSAKTKREEAFFELREVNLEISFVLDATKKAEGKLFVVELGGEYKASQTHKVTLVLDPIPKVESIMKKSEPETPNTPYSEKIPRWDPRKNQKDDRPENDKNPGERPYQDEEEPESEVLPAFGKDPNPRSQPNISPWQIMMAPSQFPFLRNHHFLESRRELYLRSQSSDEYSFNI